MPKELASLKLSGALLGAAALLGTVMILASASSVSASSDEISAKGPVDIVAATVRQEGHSCDNPTDIEADPEYSSPDQKAWILTCESGRYRVKYKGGDAGAFVEPLG